MAMNSQINIACGTDDGVAFTEEHFGSAKFYLLYSMDLETGELEYVGKTYNTTSPEETHGDPKKAKSVSELMKGVHILMGSAMGPNIVRIRKNFIPVVSREKYIESAMEKLKDKLSVIKRNLEMPIGEDREIIHIG